MSDSPAPQPAKSGSSALKIILIVVAVFVLLGILGAGVIGYGIWHVAHSVVAKKNGDTYTLNTPGGSITTNSSTTFTASDLGVDIYPGAQATKDGMRMSTPNGSVITGIFLTADSKEKVVDFYKSKLGSSASVLDTDTDAILSNKLSDKESIMVSISAKPSENDGKTKFAIVHTKNK